MSSGSEIEKLNVHKTHQSDNQIQLPPMNSPDDMKILLGSDKNAIMKLITDENSDNRRLKRLLRDHPYITSAKRWRVGLNQSHKGLVFL